jgi:hypothetical protein
MTGRLEKEFQEPRQDWVDQPPSSMLEILLWLQGAAWKLNLYRMAHLMVSETPTSAEINCSLCRIEVSISLYRDNRVVQLNQHQIVLDHSTKDTHLQENILRAFRKEANVKHIYPRK